MPATVGKLRGAEVAVTGTTAKLLGERNRSLPKRLGRLPALEPEPQAAPAA